MGKNRYTEIVDALAGDLAAARPGTRVASEHEIAIKFDVSRSVAGAAMRELESRLLVRRVRGSGTFVNERIDYVISPGRVPSWHQTVRDAGAVPRSVVRGIEAAPLPPDVADRLERAPGSPGHCLIRQGYINDLLSGLAYEWIPDDVFPAGAEVAVRAVESVDQILRQMAHVEPARTWCRVSMESPPAGIAAALEVDPGRQVWLVESVNRDASRGFPVLCNTWWARPDVVRVIVEMSGTQPHTQTEAVDVRKGAC